MELICINSKQQLATLSSHRINLPEEFVSEVSFDMQHLNQYFTLREYIYRTDLGLKNFIGAEDSLDEVSQFVLLRKGHFVVAGSRLTIRKAKSNQLLPLESDHFRITSLFPDLVDIDYCELGRTVVLPEYRNGQLLDEMFRVAAEAAMANGCKYILGVSPPAVARRFKTAYNLMGFPSIILNSIKPPVKPIHEHLKLKFLIGSLSPKDFPLPRLPN